MIKAFINLFIALGLAILLSSCSIIIERQTSSLADSLAAAILDNDDLETVKDGAPAFLLIVDGLINNSPESPALLAAGAELNSAYAGVFVEDEARKKLMSDKALSYAAKALCLREEKLCEFSAVSLQKLQAILAEIDEDSYNALYTYASTWVGWIQVNSSDWLAISQLPKIKTLLHKLVDYDPAFKDGAVYMYLGGMETIIPPAMGGKPELGKEYLEKAYSISQGKNLMAQVLLAEQYARLVFDQELHDAVLQKVLATNPKTPGYTLMNVMAQQRAAALLADSADYF